MKNVLITGKNSFIGTTLEKLLLQEPDKFNVESLDMRGESWRMTNFSKYDVIVHVAAIVHNKEKPEMEVLYLKVNRDLPVDLAIIAKNSGVSQFIFMSSMAIYGEEGKLCEELIINRTTPVNPKNFYSISKFLAETELEKLNEIDFKVVILRPPMVYGINCPGNYSKLESIARKLPVFPMIENKRSMIHVDKLCQFIRTHIENRSEGIYFPQDENYHNTSQMVKDLAEKNGKSIYLSKLMGKIIKRFGKKAKILNKVFGNLVYEKDL